MPQYLSHDMRSVLGLTPVSEVSDEQIWEELVTPQVKALLGGIVESRSAVLDIREGLFPGDHVFNLNNHRLFGGAEDRVRFPYLHNLYLTANGALVIKRDGGKFKAFGWLGDVMRGRGELVYLVSLRDRRFDGTLRANDSALVDFPYDEAEFNHPVWYKSESPLASVETSLYSWLPGSRIASTCGDDSLEKFMGNPYLFVDRPGVFMRNFRKVWKSQRAPGMVASVVPDVGKLIPAAFDRVAAAAGYDLLETAPSHYHVVKWNLARGGFRYVFSDHERILQRYSDGIAAVKERGMELTRPQESWLCVLQNLRNEDAIPEDLRFPLAPERWPQDNISQNNIWLFKPLSDYAKTLFASHSTPA